MDTARLPAYRSSYLLRFHPYPRVKPSVRERILASSREDDPYESLQMSSLYLESDTSFTLNEVIHGTVVRDPVASATFERVSSLVVDLALLLTKKLSLKDD
jgi:hypothetical protein